MSEEEVKQEGPSIAELENDTKFLMEKQIKEITSQLEEIKIAINGKLVKLRLGVLQKTINKVMNTAFSDRIGKITDSLSTQFSLELRKVILEKFFASELGNLKEKITLDMKNGDYINSDAKWTKAKEMLDQLLNISVKMQWKIFQNEYLDKKKKFIAEQEEISKKLKNLRDSIEKSIRDKDYPSADTIWSDARSLVAQSIDIELKNDWEEFESEYTVSKLTFEEDQKFIDESLREIKYKIEEQVRNKDYPSADAEWSKVNDLIERTIDGDLKKYWNNYGKEYSSVKDIFQKGQKENTQKLKEFKISIEDSVKQKNYARADAMWNIVRELVLISIDNESIETWAEFEKEYTAAKIAFEEDQVLIKDTLMGLRIKIEEHIRNKDYPSAEVEWIKAKDLIDRSIDSKVKNDWKEYEDSYTSIKNEFQADQKFIEETLKEYKSKIEQDVKETNYSEADLTWEKSKELLIRSINSALRGLWNDFENSYFLKKKMHITLTKSASLNEKFAFNESIDLLAEVVNFLRNKGVDDYVSIIKNQLKNTLVLQEDYKKLLQLLVEYENKYNENYTNEYLSAALEYSKKIIEIAEKINNEDLLENYNGRKDQIEKRIAYQKSLLQEETTKLFERAKEIEGLINIDESVLPLFDEFSIGDLIGNLSADFNIAMDQIGNLLKEHRVEIKKEIENNVLLKSESGEIFQEKSKKEIQKADLEDDDNIMYNVQTGLLNPFDDSIEDAILTDMIPYNFEIMNVQVNGKSAELPEKILTKDGMELNWQFNDIPTKEGVRITYDLRRRVSRTVLFYLQKELRIIKTHSSLNPTEIEGIYLANMPFTNNFNETIQGVIIEDIVPLYYVHHIKTPFEILPESKTSSKSGDFIKWNVGDMEVGTKDYNYKLMEPYKFEEMKIKMSNLNRRFMEALNDGNLDEVVRKNQEIITKLKIVSD
jgi:hypothetical protein